MGEYDVAQICLNGHVVNIFATKDPAHNRKFCPDCGERTVLECPSCRVHIKGYYYVGGDSWLTGERDKLNRSHRVPQYCHNCGKAYPWTENRIQTAIQIFAEFGGLDDEEKKTIEDDIRNIARDVPQGELSAMRIKKIWQKYGKIAYNVIMEFASKTAAEILKNPR
jgi:hypothetical protein